VVTDLVTVHRLWFHKRVDACLVPNTIVRDLALSYGLPPERIYITGIPVSPAIANEKRSKAEIRSSLGWQPDLPTFLAVGSRRVENLMDSLRVLNHFGKPLQLAVVAGNDQELYAALQKADWHVPVHLYNFIDFMPTLMHAADGLICKAGGLVVTEALACGLPMILVDVLPGQETGNAQYVIKAGAADLARTRIAVLETVFHWMADDGALLKQRAAASNKIGLPRSAYAAAELVWQAAQAPRPAIEPKPHLRLAELARRLEAEANRLSSD
jgi:1,2-diacylglycerol 3-beta-galactosyltransferase